jgi:hypothetical protein
MIVYLMKQILIEICLTTYKTPPPIKNLLYLIFNIYKKEKKKSINLFKFIIKGGNNI